MADPQSPLLRLLDPSVRADPYPLLAEILAEAPVAEGPPGVFTVARYAHCEALLRDPRMSSDFGRATAFTPPPAAEADGPRARARTPSFLFRDPPDHTRLRRLVSRAFTPRAVEGLRPRVQRLVVQLLDAAGDQAGPEGSVDLLDALAYPLPVIVICELLGVPPDDHERFQVWSQTLSRSVDPLFNRAPEDLAEEEEALERFDGYFRTLIDRRRGRGGEDLLSALTAVDVQGDVLTEDELLSTCRLLLVAGHETTVNLIANGLLALLRHPEVAGLLRSDPAAVPGFVEEVLRHDPPVQFLARIPLVDVELDGVTIPAGAIVVLLLAAANRDPARFTDPADFDPLRADNRHLGLGSGIHYCLGAPLARLEGQIALATFATRAPRATLATDKLSYRPNANLRGLTALPVRLGPLQPARAS